MSSDRKPGKVRVVASGPAQAPAPGAAPARRRTDQPSDSGKAAPAVRPRGASLLWPLLGFLLFLVSCLLGGALLVLSGVVGPGAA
jgi:hypothetical protein